MIAAMTINIFAVFLRDCVANKCQTRVVGRAGSLKREFEENSWRHCLNDKVWCRCDVVV